MDTYDDYEKEENDTYKDSQRFRFGKLLKNLFKWLAILIIAGVYGVIFARLYFAKVPADFTGFTWTENAVNTYNADPENFEILTQDPVEVQDANGYFQIYETAFCKKADEIQLTVRYNNRNTVNVLTEKYNLGERPNGEIFVYMLRDDSGNVYTSYDFAAISRPMNEFRRIIFDGVDFASAKTLYLDVYYGEDVSEDAPMNVTFTVYNTELTSYPFKLKGPSQLKFNLSKNPAYINNPNLD